MGERKQQYKGLVVLDDKFLKLSVEFNNEN